MRKLLIAGAFALLLKSPAFAQGKIVFGSNRGGNSEIWAMNPDGTGQTNLTNSAGGEDYPNWSPDGGKIVYQGDNNILIMNADGSGQTPLGIGGNPTQPAWVPGVNKVSYARRNGDYDIYTVNTDGTGETRIIGNIYGDYYPRWSPDGSKISFYTFTGSGPVPNVFVANADGSGQKQLTTTGKDQDASWSPDGGQVVFQSARDGNNEIYVMNADGSGQARLTNNAASDTDPAFSPDGTKIVFTSNRDGDSEIYVMNADGTGVTQLTSNTTADDHANWQAALSAGAPSVRINDAAAIEGSTGTSVNLVKFTLTLSAASASPVTVTYRTFDGTAMAGVDYTAVPLTTVSFAPGETSKSITIPVFGDVLDEPDETFTVRISAIGASVADQVGIGTIKDDDAAPSLDIHSATVTEGNTGITTLNFPVNLSAPSGQTVSVHYATSDGSATAGSDYLAKSGTLTIPAGSTTANIPISVLTDTYYEDNEYFNITLDTPVNLTRLLHSTARGTINNDDTVPGLFISDATAAEGGNAVFTVTLSRSIGSPVTVAYATADGTAKAGSDYTAASGTVTIPAGQASATISVATINDNVPELTESFTLGLTNPTNATIIDGSGTGTITNDDFPDIFISSVRMREGNSGTRSMVFSISLSDPVPFTVSVNYATSDGTATAGEDYTAVSGTLTFGANQTTQTIAVPILGDTNYESDETFNVDLSGASNGLLPDPTGTGTIINDDAAPATLRVEQSTGPSGKGS